MLWIVDSRPKGTIVLTIVPLKGTDPGMFLVSSLCIWWRRVYSHVLHIYWAVGFFLTYSFLRFFFFKFRKFVISVTSLWHLSRTAGDKLNYLAKARKTERKLWRRAHYGPPRPRNSLVFENKTKGKINWEKIKLFFAGFSKKKRDLSTKKVRNVSDFCKKKKITWN